MPESYEPKRAIVTGASGFIGGRLRDALLEDGYDVIALTREGSPPPKAGRAAAIDYEKPETLKQVMGQERPELVFHVAGATKGVSYEDFHRGNVMPTRNLLSALATCHPAVRRFVHVSSLTAYGPSTPEAPLKEDDEPRPVEHYGRSKLEAEQVVEEFREQVPSTIIRPPTVYGPGDVDNFELFRLVKRRLNVFYGNRDRYMSAVYVDDLVRGIRQAAESDATRGKGYFVCDGQPRTWGEYQKHIVAASGAKAFELNLPEFFVGVSAAAGELMTKLDGKPRLYNRQKAMLARQIAWTCRHDAARRDFDYKPQVPIEQGVEETFAWYREAGWL